MKRFLLMILGATLLWGCYPQGPEYYEDLDVVVTSFEKDFDFSVQGTYHLPDAIVKLEGGTIENGGEPEYLPEGTTTEILARIRTNMTDLGWEEKPDDEPADVDLLPAVWTNTTVYYWYDYWCWYYPYYCGYGWGYPSTSSYTTGTFVMAMLVNDEAQYPAGPYRVWTAGVNGLLSGAYDITRVNNGIDQAFEQSPYLKIN
jgi:hypothetical protein